MDSLLDQLQTLSESDFYPCHMPGHKRFDNSVFALDITEIDDFDNLHHATGIIKESQDMTAKLYGALESYYLINGSTCGLLSAIFAAFEPGDKVLVARNCHKAVYNALEIRGLDPLYIYPDTETECDISVGITARQVEGVLSNLGLCMDENKTEHTTQCNIKGMILTSPTYEGLLSEVKEIAEIMHSHNMILIVDEAHGAHFGFHPAFPVSAVTQGADLVIQSLHKTLPSMTQTALLHRCSKRVDEMKVKKYLGLFQTTSPSYVFMAYMDKCIRLLQEQGTELFQAFYKKLEDFYKKCENLQYVRVRRPDIVCGKEEDSEDKFIQYASDPGKVVIRAQGLSGKELYHILRERYHLQPEMCAGNYVLAIMTICDSQEGFTRLYEALEELEKEIAIGEHGGNAVDAQMTPVSLLKGQPLKKFNPHETEIMEGEMLELEKAEGRISKEYIYLYPPGIPFIVPGEAIGSNAVEGLINLRDAGYELRGMADISGKSILVVREND